MTLKTRNKLIQHVVLCTRCILIRQMNMFRNLFSPNNINICAAELWILKKLILVNDLSRTPSTKRLTSKSFQFHKLQIIFLCSVFFGYAISFNLNIFTANSLCSWHRCGQHLYSWIYLWSSNLGYSRGQIIESIFLNFQSLVFTAFQEFTWKWEKKLYLKFGYFGECR